MRAAIIGLVWVLGHPVSAQFAAGAFGGAAEDRIWQTELWHVGVLGEFRTTLVPSAGVRASLWFCPLRHEHTERYSTVDEPGPYTWLSSKTDDRMRSAGVAIDLKFPFENNACLDGYYKGTYLLAGIGYSQRWQTIDQWEQDRDGEIRTSSSEKNISEPMIRAGFGGEWNFPWGGPFIEGMISASAPGLGPPSYRFPAAAWISVGYRYSFAKPDVPDAGEP